MSRIWILNHYANKNGGRHPELAKEFLRIGFEPVIFLSSYQRENKSYLFDEEVHYCKEEGVTYVYLHTKPAFSGNGAGRVINMLDFCAIMRRNRRKIVKHIGAPQYIIASSVHPFVWEVGYSFAKRYKAKFVAEVRDLWPLSLIEVQHTSPQHPFVKLISVVEKRAYRRADAVVTSMPFAYKYICDELGFDRGKVHWMPNGIDIRRADQALTNGVALPQPLDEYLTKHWCCIYTGSFVDSECVDFMIESFSKLKDTDIHFAVVGDGHCKDSLSSMIAEQGLSNVQMFPYISKDEVTVALDKAKCCLAASHDYPIYKYGLSTNKLSEYLYAGRPVVFVCSYENVVGAAGQTVIPCGDTDAFVEAIKAIREGKVENIEEICSKSRQYIADNYDYRSIAAKYIELLESL